MPPKKEPEAPVSFFSSFFTHPDPFVAAVFGLVTLFVIVYLLNAFILLLGSIHISENLVLAQLTIQTILGLWWVFYLKIFLFILAVLFLSGSLYYGKKLLALRAEEKARLYPEITAVEQAKNKQWEKILNHIESTNENDWRQAIIEADIMLDKLLNDLNLHGDSIGDKLKSVDKSDFRTLDSAWEAHKIRNQVAHGGSEFILTHRGARETISHYEAVFTEHKII